MCQVIPYGHDYTDSAGEPLPERRIRLKAASQFEIRPPRWGWAGRMPLGELTIIPGREGVGKSLFLAWMAAQLTRGTLPGQFHGLPKPVFYAANEDSWNYTIAPRLLVAGADLDLVYRIRVTDETGPGRLCLPLDCARIGDAARDVGVAALMLDPIVSLVDERISPNQSFELRRALEPLRAAAERADMFVAALVHFNKDKDSDVLSRVPGGRAWAEVARAAFALAANPEDENCVASTIKNNLGRLDLPHLAYVIESVALETDYGPADVGRLKWVGESDVGVADLLERRERGAGRPTSETTNSLVDYVIKSGRVMRVQEVADHFPEVKYFTVQKTLKRAAERGELKNPIHGHYGPAWDKENGHVA